MVRVEPKDQDDVYRATQKQATREKLRQELVAQSLKEQQRRNGKG